MPTVPVSGKVTFDGGPPPHDGTMSFISVGPSEGLPQRDGNARFGVDGAFSVTSYREGDGLLPGTYQVQVNCYKHDPDYGNADPFEEASAISPDYQPMEITIEKGKPVSNLLVDVLGKK